MTMPQTPCCELKVLACHKAADPSFVTLILENPGWSAHCGQFVMLRPNHWGQDLIWPRPFSICDLSKDGLHIFFQTVGRGTRRLAELIPGQTITVWGPLGRWFRLDTARPNLIVAGGMGIAPFVLLAHKQKPAQISMLFGHRLDRTHYPFAQIASQIPSESMQQKNPTDLAAFEQVLSERIKALAGKGQILACGPEPMLKVIHKYCLLYGTDGQISLENRMACGVGACLGCVARTVQGEFVQSCVHGPVFDVRQIDVEA